MKNNMHADKVKHPKKANVAQPKISQSATTEKRYRISGHESFPCRYAWLPKVVRLVRHSPQSLLNDEDAMVEMGLGKNMVKSARFWAQAANIITLSRNGVFLTPFGDLILGKGTLDPFLEDIRTLWLIHWNLSTDVSTPLLAWDLLLSRWQEPEIIPSAAVRFLYKEASVRDDKLSLETLQRHVEVFLHSYIPTRGKKGKVQEDSLDCPLVELALLQKTAERESALDNGEHESVYIFRREEKPEISSELFTYCLADYWLKHHKTEHTLVFHDVAHGHGSPGQVFKLPEADVRTRLETINATSCDYLVYTESAHLHQIRRTGKDMNLEKLLKHIYTRES